MRVDKTLSRSPRLVRATSRLNSVRPSLQTLLRKISGQLSVVCLSGASYFNVHFLPEGGRRDLGVLRDLEDQEQDRQSGEGHRTG